MGANISEEYAASIFRIKADVPLIWYYLPNYTVLHS
jgi:hypothetical protein